MLSLANHIEPIILGHNTARESGFWKFISSYVVLIQGIILG